MPSTPRLQSDLLVLVRSLPTVKDSVQAKQGLRNLRDELLYRKSDKPVLLTDAAKMEELEISDLLQAWLPKSSNTRKTSRPWSLKYSAILMPA